jgi:N-acetylglucosamine-6-sulfatase
VLTDDLSMNLVPYMPHVNALAKAGTTFANYTVTDSLCCPSRSSLFSGEYPHHTGVFTNGGKDGGFQLFHDRGEEPRRSPPRCGRPATAPR